MLKKLVGIIIFALVANACARVAIVVFHDQQFDDAVREIALFGAGKSDETLRANVMAVAAQHSVPVDADFVEISRRTLVAPNDKVVIKVSYAVMVQIAPGYQRRF